ncbi:hypothetical protein HanIR_Chr14g0695921 [Helianthus annuus]|nr:hypothetical protein HanIR_Chr14g0695921 [Helianthus annuus]
MGPLCIGAAVTDVIIVPVTICESQIEASWTALNAWKSGNKVT